MAAELATEPVAVEDLAKGDRIIVRDLVYVVGHPTRPLSTLVAFDVTTEAGDLVGEYLDRVGNTVQRLTA